MSRKSYIGKERSFLHNFIQFCQRKTMMRSNHFLDRLSPSFLSDVARGQEGRRMKIEEQQIACHSVKSASGRGAENAPHLMASIDCTQCTLHMHGVQTRMGADCIALLGPEILLPIGCVKLGNYFAFCSPTAGRRTQINYAISPNPWEVIFPAPVHTCLPVCASACILASQFR